MKAHALDLKQFRATRQAVDRCPEIFLEGPGFIYADRSCSIDLEDGEPVLHIFQQEWRGKSLAELEYILWEQFYLPEICGYSEQDVADLLHVMAEYEKDKQS